MVMLKYAWNSRVQAMIIKAINASLLNVVLGLLYTSTASKAESIDASSVDFVFPFLSDMLILRAPQRQNTTSVTVIASGECPAKITRRPNAQEVISLRSEQC